MTLVASREAESAEESLRDRLVTPVSAASLAAFRIGFGLLMGYGSLRFLAKGWVQTLYLAPDHHLTYPGLGWVEPWPSLFMHLHVAGLAVAGLAIAVGFRTRLAAALFLVGFTYTELIDAALYLNHYWLVSLVAGLLVFLPTEGLWSIDSWSGRVPSRSTVPVLAVYVLRFQLAVVYLFAGLAKLNPDWLLRAEPLRTWLADRTHLWLVGGFLDGPPVAFAVSWAGAAFDCTIVGWLLWRRSRPYAYVAVVSFHLITGQLFPIGVFPLVMIAATPIFFSPDWPLRLGRRLGLVLPVPSGDRAQGHRLSSGVLAVVAVWAVLQVLVPLRHLAYPGNVRFTEEGYTLSWRVMVTEKVGVATFVVDDPATGRSWRVEPESVLTDWQARQATMRPDLLVATAHLVAEDFARRGIDDVEVRAESWVTFNGRPAVRLVDPTVDLAARSRTAAPRGYIEPAPD